MIKCVYIYNHISLGYLILTVILDKSFLHKHISTFDMYKIFLLTIVCVAIVSGNLQDDIKAKASDALHQGEKLKVGFQSITYTIIVICCTYRIK